MADSAASAEQEKPNRLAAQLKKLSEANAKYKNLLKLAKERIQQQEEELESIRNEKNALEKHLSEDRRDAPTKEVISLESEGDRANDEVSFNIARVCQRVKAEQPNNGQVEIWALIEMEVVPLNEMEGSTRRFKEWKRFDSESELQDFIRRDTGEPITLPPYSLSPEQSAKIQQNSSLHVAKMTEEFRRFRVKAELSRKQAEAQIASLQSNNFQSAARRIEGQDVQYETEQVRALSLNLERLKAELAAQDAHWKEAYDLLVAENNALKSSGSEALLASQWRQRYETCLQEKKELAERVKVHSSKVGLNGGDTYEAKYKDLKESFRLYRKKAKEIFEAQERGAVPPMTEMDALNIAETSSAEAKLSYLKNLMVNYLSADQTVRDHMESAIGTVLQFSPDEVDRINTRKKAEAWF